MSNKLYVDDMLIAEVPDEMRVLPPVNFIAPLPNTVKYQSSVNRTNCCNCGAPLQKHGKCMYCGTENNREAPEEQNNARSEIKITPSSITFTCEPVMKYYQYESVATMDVYGRLHRKVINYNE